MFNLIKTVVGGNSGNKSGWSHTPTNQRLGSTSRPSIGSNVAKAAKTVLQPFYSHGPGYASHVVYRDPGVAHRFLAPGKRGLVIDDTTVQPVDKWHAGSSHGGFIEPIYTDDSKYYDVEYKDNDVIVPEYSGEIHPNAPLWISNLHKNRHKNKHAVLPHKQNTTVVHDSHEEKQKYDVRLSEFKKLAKEVRGLVKNHNKVPDDLKAKYDKELKALKLEHNAFYGYRIWIIPKSHDYGFSKSLVKNYFKDGEFKVMKLVHTIELKSQESKYQHDAWYCNAPNDFFKLSENAVQPHGWNVMMGTKYANCLVRGGTINIIGHSTIADKDQYMVTSFDDGETNPADTDLRYHGEMRGAKIRIVSANNADSTSPSEIFRINEKFDIAKSNPDSKDLYAYSCGYGHAAYPTFPVYFQMFLETITSQVTYCGISMTVTVYFDCFFFNKRAIPPT